VRDTVLKAQPGWRWYRYVIGVVNAPVCAGKNLLRVIRVNNNRIDRNIRQIARLVYPRKRTTVGSAGDLENVTGRRRRISIKPAYSCVPDGQIRSCDRRIQSNTQHGA
jgi:hypothetical protein